jgi:nicotinamide mononucleotide adenylyltransferase
LQNPDEKPEYMTKYIERNWAKWEANLAPILAAAEKQDKSVRRMTIKMCEDDPAEETKQPFSQASDLTMAEQMFQKIGISTTVVRHRSNRQL